METITGFIYYLQNPTTGEIFYVGATEHSIKHRLRTHYQHLKEFEKGQRKSNRRFEYLLNLKPLKATINLLETVSSKEALKEREIFYIKGFREINPNLTNMTDGGKGEHTSKYYTEKEMEEYSMKISKANKGRKKPTGFAENLSLSRKGFGNPATRELKNWIILKKEDGTYKLFKYGFLINDFLNNKNGYSNVLGYLKGNRNLCYNLKWYYFNTCSKEIQDIVQSSYENEK